MKVSLGPIIFNIFPNDLQAVLEKSQLYNFADDNTISAEANNTDDLLKTFKEESESAVKWFRGNNMIIKPDEFQVIAFPKEIKNKNTKNNTLNIENIKISQTIRIIN